MSVPQELIADYPWHPVMAAPSKEKQQGLTDWTAQDRIKIPASALIPKHGVEMTGGRELLGTSGRHVFEDIRKLKSIYLFTSDELIASFLTGHSAVARVLLAAETPLKRAFGDSAIFDLQLSRDEDGSTILYAVVIWRESMQGAVDALKNFDDDWWLDHMSPATASLVFTYELA